jgi:serine/threonine protein kinase
MAMGTVAYMSPEQARGEKVDARTDLFSFGAVLYEMATGKQAFSGNTTAVIFHAILAETPTSPISLNPRLPQELERIVNKALEKDRSLRYQHAADILADLRRLKRDTDSARSAAVPAAVARASRSHTEHEHGQDARATAGETPELHRRWTLALAGLLALIAASGLVWFATHRAPPPPAPQLTERRLTTNPSENSLTQAAISPDGKYLAYGDQAGMHLKLVQTGQMVTIPQAEGPAPQPGTWFPEGWFPDGTKFIAVGLEAGQGPSAWVVSVMGGPPRKLRDDADAWSVSPDGTLIAFGVALVSFAPTRSG